MIAQYLERRFEPTLAISSISVISEPLLRAEHIGALSHCPHYLIAYTCNLSRPQQC